MSAGLVLAGSFALAACGGGHDAAAEPAPAIAPADFSAVVIESSAARYNVGAELEAGSEIVLAAGETLVLMHRSGAVRAYETPGQHPVDQPADDRVVTARAAMAALLSDAPRPEIGATRSFDYDACIEAATAEDGFPVSLCHQLQVDHAEAANLSVGLVSVTGSVMRGAPVTLELTASFDAYTRCRLQGYGDGADHTPLVLGGERSGAVFLDSGVIVHAPMRGSPKLMISDAPGTVLVRCEAFEAQLWRDLGNARAYHGGSDLADEAWRNLVARYSAMVGAKYAEADLVIDIVE